MWDSKNNFRVLTAQRAMEYRAEEQEEGFLLDRAGRVVQSVLPYEKKHTPLLYRGGNILFLNRTAELIGLCGAGTYEDETGTSIGAWGRFFCRYASASKFVSLHSREMANGTSPETILSEAFRPQVSQALNAAVLSGSGEAELRADLLPLLRKEAARQGVTLEYFKLEFYGLCIE